MTTEPSFRSGAEFFTSPEQSNHRRYEALRAYFVEGLTYEQAGRRFGYSRWAMVDLVREYKAGRLALFAPPRKPGPERGSTSIADHERDRVIELWLEGMTIQQIAVRMAAEGAPLGRAGVSDVLRKAGLRRKRRAMAQADSRLPGAGLLDFNELPNQQETALAGLLFAIPDLVALDLPGLVGRAGYPDTRRVPAVSWLLALLTSKLLDRRWRSLPPDPAVALLAGLTALPREAALTDYSYWLPPSIQRALLAAMGHRASVFDVDVQAVGHWDSDPEVAHEGGTRPRKAITMFVHDADTGRLVFTDAGADPQTLKRGFIMAFLDHWRAASGSSPQLLIVGRRVASRKVLRQLQHGNVSFLTRRPGSPGLTEYLSALTPHDYRLVRIVDRDYRVHDEATVPLPGFQGSVRQLNLSPDDQDSSVLITNDSTSSTEELLERYFHHIAVEGRLAELVRTYGTESWSSSVNLNVDVDVTLLVLVQALLASLATRVGALATIGPAAFRKQLFELPGQIIVSDDAVTVRLYRRAWSPILRKVVLPEQTIVPWWGGRMLRYQVG